MTPTYVLLSLSLTPIIWNNLEFVQNMIPARLHPQCCWLHPLVPSLQVPAVFNPWHIPFKNSSFNIMQWNRQWGVMGLRSDQSCDIIFWVISATLVFRAMFSTWMSHYIESIIFSRLQYLYNSPPHPSRLYGDDRPGVITTTGWASASVSYLKTKIEWNIQTVIPILKHQCPRGI